MSQNLEQLEAKLAERKAGGINLSRNLAENIVDELGTAELRINRMAYNVEQLQIDLSKANDALAKEGTRIWFGIFFGFLFGVLLMEVISLWA